MSEINVQLNGGPAVSIPESTTVAEALKKLDRDLAKQALAAKVNGVEVDLTAELSRLRHWTNIEDLALQTMGQPIGIDPILPGTRDGHFVYCRWRAALRLLGQTCAGRSVKLKIRPTDQSVSSWR